VLIYKTQLALNQAATDAAQVISAQSSSGATNGVDVQADASGLAALRGALASVDLGNLSGLCSNGLAPTYNAVSHVQSCANGSSTSGVDIFSDDGSGSAQTWPVYNSEDMVSGPSPTSENISLDNHYVYSPGTATCPVDQSQSGVYQFSLTNSLANTTNPIPQSPVLSGALGAGQSWVSCALPWNGTAFDATVSTGNMNGRHDERCDEETVNVTIRYNYISAAFPIHWGIQLVGVASLPIEPRQYEENSAAVQASTGTCS
jgi:hypothetical protein